MIDLIIILMYLVLAAAIAALVWAIVRTLRIVGKTSGKSHGIPVRRINSIVCAGIVIIMLLSFIIGNTEPMRINAQTYNDTFWLRMSNMFVFTGVTAIVVAAITMLYSAYKVGKYSGRTMVADLANDICHIGHKVKRKDKTKK